MAKFGRKKKKDALVDDHSHELGLSSDTQETDESLQKKGKFEAIKASISKGRHRKMEHLSRNFIIATSIFVLGGAYSVYHGNVLLEQKQESVTSAGSKVKFSKTTAQMTLGSAYTTSDKATTFVPVTFSDMSALSTNAEDYYILVSRGSNAFSYSPNVQLVLFGETGRAAFIVNGSPRIANEAFQVVLRNDKLLVDKDTEGKGFSNNMKGFGDAAKLYDMLTFTINPGADSVRKTKELTSDNIAADDLYRVLFGNDDVDVIKEDIKKSRKNIELAEKKIKEYRERLDRNGYELPEEPAYMAKNWKPENAISIDVDGSLKDGYMTEDSDAIVDDDGVDIGAGSLTHSSVIRTTASSDSSDKDGLQGSTDRQENDYEGLDSVDDSASYSPENPGQEGVTPTLNGDVFDLPSELIRDDGTSSEDDINKVATAGGETASEIWKMTTRLYQNILKEKQTIYVDDAMKLTQIQRELDRQSRITSISSGERFRSLSEIKVSTK